MIKKYIIKVIENSKGNIIKFADFKKLPLKKMGEIYFSEVKPKVFKGWKYHNSRNQYLTVISGNVDFFFKKKINSKIKKVSISSQKPYAIFIPKKIYYSFKCCSKNKAIIINIIDEIIK